MELENAASPLATPVRELMSTDVISVAPSLSLRDALELLAARHIGGAPVVQGHHVVGVLSMSDILSFEASNPVVPGAEPDQTAEEPEPTPDWREGEDPPSAYFADFWADAGGDVVERLEQTGTPEWDLLAEHTVSEAMTRSVVGVRPETPVRSAARLMTRLDIHRVLVLDAGKLCGVVTSMDVVRAAGRGRI
jgi:CBS domain-containing protein